MFFGEYHHQIDEKGRVRIPTKLKDLLGATPFITCSSNHCLMVMRREDAEKMFEKKFGEVDIMSPAEDNAALRLMASRGFVAEADSQGRFLLPAHLIRHAQLQKNVVTIGAYNRVEIWSEENWTAYSGIDGEAFDRILTREPQKEA